MSPVLSFKPARINLLATVVCFLMAVLTFTVIVNADTPSFQTFAEPVNVVGQSAPLDVESLTFDTFCKVPAVVGALPVSFETFASDTEPDNGDAKVLLFGADWCRYCKVAEEKAIPWLKKSGWKVDEVNFDRRSDLVAKYNVKLLPSFVVVFNGIEHGRAEGFDSKRPDQELERLNKMIQKANQSRRASAR